ncbi:hypothetical protein C8J57DRAFT_1723892 [Mycena rebaudengoi]|nr:hypothetical protein C8J57DRAFT_1723892 [Mycena rebaudengoi]
MSEIYLRLNLIYGSSHRTPLYSFGVHGLVLRALDYLVVRPQHTLPLVLQTCGPLGFSSTHLRHAHTGRCAVRTAIAFEIVADTDIWSTQSQACSSRSLAVFSLEASTSLSNMTQQKQRGKARSSRGGAHAQGEKARTEIDGAQRGENTVITRQLRENEAISARAEVNGARIFMPSDVFGQHTLGSLN